MIGRSISGRDAVIWLLGLALASPLAGVVVMDLRTTHYSGPAPRIENSRMAIGAGALKMELESDAGLNHTLVFRGGEAPPRTAIDHREKSYLVLDRAAIQALGMEMQMAMHAATAKIGELAPEQRQIVQKMIEAQFGRPRGEPPPPPSTVIKTDDRDLKSGLPCVKHEVFRRGEKLREVWTAPSSEVPGGEAALGLLREMSDFYSTLMGSLEKVAPGLGSFRSDRSPFEDLARMNGFPVLTRNFAGGRVDTEIALLSVEEQRLSAAEFELPAGYSPAAKGASGPTKS